MKQLSYRLGAALTLLTIAASAHAQTNLTQDPFTDVPKTSANYEAVEYLRTQNVLRGYPDGTFRADNRITRSEFVKLLTNPFFLSGRSNDCLLTHFRGENSTRLFFADVRQDAWYAQDVCEAVVHELIRGYPDGTFKPQRPISFVEGAKIIARVFSQDVKAEQGFDEKWYTAYVTRLAGENAIPLTIKRFDQPLTRGEMAEIIFRLKTANRTKASMTFEQLQ